jgi:hypothetical protein
MKSSIIKYLFLLILAGVFTTSCKNWLNLLPEDDLVSDEFWKSQEDVEAVLFNNYGLFSTQTKTLLYWGELRSGNIAEGLSTPTDAGKIINGDITDANSLTVWSGLYKTINGANLLLKYAPDVISIDPSFTSAELHQILAEAYFLRAISYFYLARTFYEVPIITEPIVSDDQDYYPEKASNEAIIIQILDDLKIAESWASSSYGTIDENKGRATVYAVHALLADVYLWNDQYDLAASHCDEIINSGNFGLLGANNWFQNFYPGNSNSSIFEIQFSKKWGATSGLYESYSYQQGKDFIINPRIISLFTPDDIRGRGATYGIKNVEVWKYVGINTEEERGVTLNDNNLIIYRLADIILLKAEALGELGNFAEALSLINSVRQKRGIADATVEPSSDAIEDLVYDERTRELAGEGKSWFDLIRISKRNNFKRKEKIISALILNADASVAPSLSIKFQDPYSWFLPIYKGELDINTNLVQNPYYSN